MEKEAGLTLDAIAQKHGADKSTQFHGYTPIYEKYFESMRDEPVSILEVGYQFGFGLKTFSEYFHNGEIYGVDIADGFKTDNPHIHLSIGNQSDPIFWKNFMPGLQFDAIIDDASHLASDQIVCFENMWPRIKSGKYYVVEDTFTWPDPLWHQQEKASNFLEGIVWALNKGGKQYYGRPQGRSDPLTQFENSIEWIHCYPGLVMLKKK